MNLIDLVKEIGLQPFKTAATNGGEYHCPCPTCGGVDRFAIWPIQKQDKCIGRYWCRQCGANGDAISFCRNFLRLSWEDSLKKLNIPSIDLQRIYMPVIKNQDQLQVAKEPSAKWKEKALIFVEDCHCNLFKNSEIIHQLYERGLSDEIIKQFKLGYCCNSASGNMKDFFDDYTEWGLESVLKEDGKLKRLWLPRGLVIPCFSGNGDVLKINIRRLDWHEEDKLGKYIKVTGSIKAPAVYGDVNKRVAIILESEFDAILIQQFAADVCFCIATGGSTQPLDIYTDHLIRKSILFLICPDVDAAGAKFLHKLQEQYKQAKLWPSPKGKSPGDALKDHKVDLREWVMQGLPAALKPQQKDLSYDFTCKNCSSHDYWISIFDSASCMHCINPDVDETIVKSRHIMVI